MKCFYRVDEFDIETTFYATGQGYEVAPFGSIRSGFSKGWSTPSFLAMTLEGEEIIKGGSSVGAFPLLPYLGLNPFILGDDYKKVYDKIAITKNDRIAAYDYIDKIASEHYYNEGLCRRVAEPSTQIVEPAVFNKEMWLNILRAEAEESDSIRRGYYLDAIKWAQKVVSDPVWIKLAKRDNMLKEAQYHGIIYCPWGLSSEEDARPAHRAIGRYPILNEVGTAMWGLVTANFELGNKEQARYWIGRIIDDVPLHQIAATEKAIDDPGKHHIIGYWNALVSWEKNPGGGLRNSRMSGFYKEVLEEKGFKSAMPKTVELIGGVEELSGKTITIGKDK